MHSLIKATPCVFDLLIIISGSKVDFRLAWCKVGVDHVAYGSFVLVKGVCTIGYLW